MSRIHAVRLINLNYNNNSIHIDDELFEFNSKSTLLSLRNGGGKSVLVQMLMAPFVHKKYRSTKERPFESYFTTKQPTFILVEWALDGGAGYVLTGMMVRQANEKIVDELNEPLEIIQFIHEYIAENEWDMMHIPVIDVDENGSKHFKRFHEIKQMFEETKKEKKYAFSYYDMNMVSQSRMYYSKLKEYGIDYREWEGIMKKVNLKESGLSELFQNAKDEAGLIDQWFLDAVENKLSREENRVRKFVELVASYVTGYRKNQANVNKVELIDQFKEDANGLLEIATSYEEQLAQAGIKENEIANLIYELRERIVELKKVEAKKESEIAAMDAQIKEIEYDEFSFGIHQNNDRLTIKTEEKKKLLDQLEGLKKELQSVENSRRLMELAKLYKDYAAASKEVKKYENELEILKKDSKTLEPERNQLGYNLRIYHEEKVEAHEEKVTEIKLEIETMKEMITSLNDEITIDHHTVAENKEKQGVLSGKIDNYTNLESKFNDRYEEQLQRNILGDYEPGTLDERKVAYTEKIEQIEDHKKQAIRKREEIKEESNELGHTLEEAKESLSLLKLDQIRLAEQKNEFEEEIIVRKTLLPYVKLGEEDVFEREKILLEFEKRILSEKAELHAVMAKADKEQAEYDKLKSGKVLELPKEFESQLKEQEIAYVYGMEWLKENALEQEKLDAVIKANPFLPYALVMTQQDMIKLENANMNVYTSSPVPIVVREQLEEKLTSEKNSRIYQFGAVSFYVSFNHNLLNKEGLESLLKKQEDKIASLKENVQQLSQEITFFEEKMNLIKYQKMTKKSYDSLLTAQKQNEKKISEAQAMVTASMTRMALLQKESDEISIELNQMDQTKARMIEQIKDFEELVASYREYIEQLERRNKLKNATIFLLDGLKDKQRKLKDCEECNARLNGDLSFEFDALKDQKNEKRLYETFVNGKAVEDFDYDTAKARFDSISKQVHEEQHVIEENLRDAKTILEERSEDLTFKAQQYNVLDESYKKISYNRYAESELMTKLEKLRAEETTQSEGIHSIEIELSKLNQDVRYLTDQMVKRLGKGVVKPKDQITATNFASRKNAKIADKNTLLQVLEEVKREHNSFDIALSGLSGFEYCRRTSEIKLDFTVKTIEELKSEMLMEYRAAQESIRGNRENLAATVAKVLRKEMYQDDFFAKPLEALEKMMDKPKDCKEHLMMTMQSYDAILDKLKVDLACLTQEEENVLVMLLDYVHEVHDNLGKIDRNSTIQIRGKSIKMLKIILPDWEEGKVLYEQHLKDCFSALVKRCMECFNKNENIEEVISKVITTKNLYHQVVGIGNIEICLYKIEEEKEYPISWTDVSKNSGGEGFLSAFVILSSLLCYMRREDTDLFVNKQEGKVLIMDNPFAQTNAAHLLKPLMEIAKKTNTQLICLSGLGGESIYNRFDQIYVLNLIPSMLKKNMQYLKAEHAKGEEVQAMTVSEVKVEEAEQIRLF
ncbi:DNA double-strand break repair Rad50 ATPase [Lachnospiraceae bacterium KM106-2]|nr:DNA double-strand break repair Rad50 ATPase [Lachnospiraceae bacterium KM106-2]